MSRRLILQNVKAIGSKEENSRNFPVDDIYKGTYPRAKHIKPTSSHNALKYTNINKKLSSPSNGQAEHSLRQVCIMGYTCGTCGLTILGTIYWSRELGRGSF